MLGLDLGEFLAMAMFVVFMAMILTGYNVAFSFASTALSFAFVGDVFGSSGWSRSAKTVTRPCWRCRCSS